MRPDLLLVNPGDRMQIYQALGKSLSAVEPPVWVGLLASFARKRGLSVEILDANALQLTPEQAAVKAIDANAVLTAVVVYGHNPSASTQVMPSAGAICSAIKDRAPSANVLLVGGHVSSLPERTLREERADFACSGEGPFTVVELAQALKGGAKDFSKVSGLVYREGGEVRFTAPAPLVENLEVEMPGVTWDLLPMEKYRAHNWHCFGGLPREPYASMYTTLGCPYHCSFCCIQAPFKEGEKASGLKDSVNTYRFWSPEHIVADIDRLVKKYGVRNIKFADEMFVLNPKHVLGICELLIPRKYGLNIWAYARVDTVRDNMIDKLREAGFRWLAFGIESANERVRKDVQKGFGQEEIFKTLEKVRKAGINICANYIFGLPEDDAASMQETLDLALEVNAEYANFYCAMAYPGSELYEQALREKWELPGKWSGYSQHAVDSKPLPTKYLSAGQVLAFRDKAFQIYNSSPRYIEMMEKKFGAETVRGIREMASVKLERQFAAS